VDTPADDRQGVESRLGVVPHPEDGGHVLPGGPEAGLWPSPGFRRVRRLLRHHVSWRTDLVAGVGIDCAWSFSATCATPAVTRGKRITWLRDPVERAWSLLNHTLEVRNNGALFQLVETEFLDRGVTDREQIFKSLIHRRPRFFREYEANYQSLDREFFHFIGCTDRYEEDLRRLAETMQMPLAAERLNRRSDQRPTPSLNSRELAVFDEEYRIYERLTQTRS
jgi:hypothetical protein